MILEGFPGKIECMKFGLVKDTDSLVVGRDFGVNRVNVQPEIVLPVPPVKIRV